MLVKKSIIEPDTRKYFEESFDKSFQYKEGSDLEHVIDEVLHDKNIFTYFALYFKAREGLKLGETSYWDDIRVHCPYGLIMDFDHIPRQLKIFNYEVTSPKYPKRNIEVTLGYSIRRKDNEISPEFFIRQVNDALKEPNRHLIEFNDQFKISSF